MKFLLSIAIAISAAPFCDAGLCVLEGNLCYLPDSETKGLPCCAGATCFAIFNFQTTGTCIPTRRTLAEEQESDQESCQKYGYHRNLKEVETGFLMEEHDACLDVLYDMFLVMEGSHLIGLFTPVEESAAVCPAVTVQVAASGSQVGDSGMQKVAMVSEVGELEVARLAKDLKCVEDSKHHLGTKPLRSIVDAFANSNAGRNGSEVYDPVTNNCAALLKNMADPLDFVVDDALVDFVARKLVSAEGDMFEQIMQSPTVSLLMEGGNRMLKGVGVDKEAIVAKLIKLYI